MIFANALVALSLLTDDSPSVAVKIAAIVTTIIACAIAFSPFKADSVLHALIGANYNKISAEIDRLIVTQDSKAQAAVMENEAGLEESFIIRYFAELKVDAPDLDELELYARLMTLSGSR
jgi:hypothetical protein